MRRIRLIPVLLLKKGGLYKSVRFKDYTYVGDPINAIKIFNDKEVDEVIVIDIEASAENRPPDYARIREMAEEAFMPMAYGGGIKELEQARKVLYGGVEKIVMNSAAIDNPDLISAVAAEFGSSSVVVSVDVKKDWLGRYRVFESNGRSNTGLDPVAHCRKMEACGAGEIFLNNIDKDGTFGGIDNNLLSLVTGAVSIPLIACGGVGSLADCLSAVHHGASAVAAGSYFVFKRPHRAVLITYPSQQELTEELYDKL